jgi:hypothetical protein
LLALFFHLMAHKVAPFPNIFHRPDWFVACHNLYRIGDIFLILDVAGDGFMQRRFGRNAGAGGKRMQSLLKVSGQRDIQHGHIPVMGLRISPLWWGGQARRWEKIVCMCFKKKNPPEMVGFSFVFYIKSYATAHSSV